MVCLMKIQHSISANSKIYTNTWEKPINCIEILCEKSTKHQKKINYLNVRPEETKRNYQQKLRSHTKKILSIFQKTIREWPNIKDRNNINDTPIQL